MRFVLAGIICLFGGAAFAQQSAQPSVPTISYVKNANNITTGKLSVDRLHVGSDANTVASGADVRFDSVSIGKPAETAPQGRALVWIEVE